MPCAHRDEERAAKPISYGKPQTADDYANSEAIRAVFT